MTSHDSPQPHDLHCAEQLRLRLLLAAGEKRPSSRLLHHVAEEIHRCCGHSPLRSHRLAWGWTFEEAVDALHELCGGPGSIGCAPDLWGKWERGKPVGARYQDLLCRLFHTGPVQLGFGTDYTDQVPEPASATSATRATSATSGTAPVLGDRPVVTPSAAPARIRDEPPGTLPARHGPSGTDPGLVDRSHEERLIMSAHQSGDYAVDVLRAEAIEVARLFANAPRYQVFERACTLRDQTFAVISDRRPAEPREAYFLAAAACGMLANITMDFGLHDAAMSHAVTAWICAERTGHNGLRSWIRCRQSEIAYHDGRFGQAADYARKGQQYAAVGTTQVWLSAVEARATSKLGDAQATRSALARAEAARENLGRDELDEWGGIMAFGTPKQHFYGAEACLGIGDSAEVVRLADACVTGYQNGPDADRAYDNMASTQVTLALAHVLGTDLDAARTALQPALGIAPELRAAPLHSRLRRLNESLTGPGVRTAPLAVEMRDQVETFLETAVLPLPEA